MRNVVNAGARFAALLVLFLAGCRQEIQSPSPSPDVVASVGTNTITRNELVRAMNQRVRALGSDAAVSANLKQAVLDELIREKVLLSKARAAEMDKDPELVRRWERMVVAKYESAHKPDAATQRAPSSAEVEQYYQAHAADYHRPERVRVALIQIKGSAKATEEKRSELRTRAETIFTLAKKPDANFAELARLHSEDRATRYTGGDCGWMERGQTPPSWPKELADAAFALETAGVIAPLVEASGSFYVLKLIERQTAGVRPLADVRDRIVYQLKEQQRIANEERFYADQKAAVNVEINHSALQAVSLPAAAVAKGPGAPPSLPSN